MCPQLQSCLTTTGHSPYNPRPSVYADICDRVSEYLCGEKVAHANPRGGKHRCPGKHAFFLQVVNFVLFLPGAATLSPVSSIFSGI